MSRKFPLTTQVPALQEGHYSNLWHKIRQICFNSHQRLSASLLRSRDILSRRLVWVILRLWDVRCYKCNYFLRVCSWEYRRPCARYEGAWGLGEVLPHTLLTSARYEGEWTASRPCSFTLGKWPEISAEYEAEWPLAPVWTFQKTKGSLPRWEQNHDMLSEMVPYVLIQQDRLCLCNLTLRCARITIVVVEKHQELYILSVSL